MALTLVQTTSTIPSSASTCMQQSTATTLSHFNLCNHSNNNSNNVTPLLSKSFLPGFPIEPTLTLKFTTCKRNSHHSSCTQISASLVDNPLLWAGRLCGFYALLKTGFAGSHSNPLLSESGTGITEDDADLGFSKWLDKFQNNPDKEAAEKRKLVSKWHPTTKGTLRRNYRIPSKPEGQRLLRAIASLLSEDDHFVDASSHKGCQIRRESAHGESVCCNNVRALFDELPTPHLIVEITPFPAGSLTDKDYAKAEKLEKVLRSSPSV